MHTIYNTRHGLNGERRTAAADVLSDYYFYGAGAKDEVGYQHSYNNHHMLCMGSV